MNYQEYVDSLTPDIVDRLRRGIETGKWPDGRALTPEQREHTLQAIIAWDRKHLPENERVGFIDKGAKAKADDKPAAMRWVSDDPDRKTAQDDGGANDE